MKKTILALTTAAVATGALAASTTTVSTSTKKSTMDKILEKTSLGYFVEYSGPNLKDTGDNTQSNAWNQIKARYKVSDKLTVFASNAFVINQEVEEGDNKYIVDDYRIGAEGWNKYSNGLSYRNRIRLESAGQAYEKGTNKTMRVRASHLVTHTAGLHNITGVMTFRKWFYDNSTEQDASTQYQLIPTVAYQYNITDKLSAYTEYSLGYDHMADTNIRNGAKSFQELYVGANYTLNKALTLGTFLYTSGGAGDSGMKADGDTSVKVQLSGSIF